MAAMRREVECFIANARVRMKGNPDLFTRPGNLIEAFLAVRDQPGSEFTDDNVYGNVFTTLLVGPDSTANVFSWITFFLYGNPGVQAAVEAEAEAEAEADSLLGLDTVLNLETAVDRFLPLDTPYELQLLCAPARSPQG